MSPFILSAVASMAVLVGTVGTASAVTLAPAQPHFDSTIMQAQYWGGPGRGCRAIGVTINGRRIPGVSGRGFGRGACAEAMAECRYELRQRQRYGYNPYGRCVVLD